MTLKDVPIGPRTFRSVTVHDRNEFAVGEKYNVYSVFAKKNEQSDYVIHLAGDENQDIYPGWNAAIRI